MSRLASLHIAEVARKIIRKCFTVLKVFSGSKYGKKIKTNWLSAHQYTLLQRYLIIFGTNCKKQMGEDLEGAIMRPLPTLVSQKKPDLDRVNLFLFSIFCVVKSHETTGHVIFPKWPIVEFYELLTKFYGNSFALCLYDACTVCHYVFRIRSNVT